MPASPQASTESGPVTAFGVYVTLAVVLTGYAAVVIFWLFRAFSENKQKRNVD